MNNLVNKRLLIIVLSSLAAFVLVFGVVYALKRQNDENSDKYSSESSQAPEPLTENYLTILLAGIDDTEMLTDVIMIGRYDIKGNKVNILQIPRDSYIGDEYKTGKINNVYSHPKEGMSKIATLKEELESRMKMDIDYYAIVTLEGLRKVVDDLGGVEIVIPDYFEDLKKSILKPGEQTLDGEQSEWLIRYREGYKTADIGRINTQELFMRAAFETIKSKSGYELSRVMMKNFSHFDTDVPINKAMSVANEAITLDNDDINVFIAPGNGKMNGSYAVYEIDEEKLSEILNEHFLLPENEVSADELDFPRVKAPIIVPNEPKEDEIIPDDEYEWDTDIDDFTDEIPEYEQEIKREE